jgi:hypothetical protein
VPQIRPRRSLFGVLVAALTLTGPLVLGDLDPMVRLVLVGIAHCGYATVSPSVNGDAVTYSDAHRPYLTDGPTPNLCLMNHAV